MTPSMRTPENHGTIGGGQNRSLQPFECARKVGAQLGKYPLDNSRSMWGSRAHASTSTDSFSSAFPAFPVNDLLEKAEQVKSSI